MLDADAALEEAVRMLFVTWKEVTCYGCHKLPSVCEALATERVYHASCALAQRVRNDLIRVSISYAPLTISLDAYISRHLPNITVVCVVTMGYGPMTIR